METPKLFPCSCGSFQHYLYVLKDPDADELIMQVANSPGDWSLRNRISMAWSILRGQIHPMSEIYLTHSTTAELASVLSDWSVKGD